MRRRPFNGIMKAINEGHKDRASAASSGYSKSLAEFDQKVVLDDALKSTRDPSTSSANGAVGYHISRSSNSLDAVWADCQARVRSSDMDMGARPFICSSGNF